MPTGIGSGIAGEVFTDEIGSGSRGGSTICPTRYSVEFNGSSQWGSEEDTKIDLGTDNFSFSFWFKTIGGGTKQGFHTTRLGSAANGLDIYLSAAGQLTADFDTISFVGSTVPSDNEWHHAVLSVDRLGDWKWYLDGVNINTVDHSAVTAPIENGGTSAWARTTNSPVDYFDGNLTELSIWGTALSSSEVLTIYNNMFGSQTCLTDLTFSSGNLIQNGSFNEIGPQLIDNPTFNAPTSPDLIVNGDFSAEGINLVDNPNFTDGVELLTQPIDLTVDFIANSGGVIDDSNSFTTAGGSVDGIVNKVTEWNLVEGNSYKLVIEGSTTSSGFTIGNYLNGDEYGTGFGTHYFVAEGGVYATRLWIRQQTAGTTDLTTFTIEELGADWNLDYGTSADTWSFSDGTAKATNSVSYDRIQQNTSLSSGSYKVTVDISTYTNGRIVPIIAGQLGTSFPESSGIYTQYVTGAGSSSGVRIASNPDFNGSLNSVSVQEVGQDWTLGAGWSIGEDKAISDGTGTYSSLRQNNIYPTSTVGKSFKISLSIEDWVSGGVRVSVGGYDTTTSLTVNNDYTVYLTVSNPSSNTSLYITTWGTFVGSITNISVQEVDWNLGGGWSLGSNKALATAADGGDTLSQAGVFTLDKSYKTTFLSTLDSGNCFAEFGSDGFIGRLPSGTASNLFYYQTNEVGDSARIAFEVQSLMTGSISNVLTYQMDPNGYWNIPTANSTQLVLNPTFTNTGPEEVTNGDFSQTALGTDLVTDGEFPSGTTAWTTQGTSTINVGSATVEGLGNLSGSRFYRGISQFISISVGTSYKITFTAKQLTGSGAMYAGLGYTQPFNQVITNDYEVYTFDQVPTNVSGYWSVVGFGGAVGSTFEIKDVSVKEVLQLVTNGDFTDTGTDLVVDGDFPSGTTAWGFVNATLEIDGARIQNPDAVTNAYITQGILGSPSGKSFVLTYDVISTNGALLAIEQANSISLDTSTTGTNRKLYFTWDRANDNLVIKRQSANLVDITIDNVRLEELGADWSVIDGGGSVTFGDSFAEIIKTGATATYLQQDYAVTLGASHKLTYTITENTLTGGGTELGLSNTSAYPTGGITAITLDASASATPKTVYLTVTNTTPTAALRFFSTKTGGSIKITDISVQELGEGWTVQDGWSIGDSKAVFDDTQTNYIAQNSPSFAIGNSYKVTFEIQDCAGTCNVTFYNRSHSVVFIANENWTNGTYTRYVTSTVNSEGFSIWGNTALDSFSITNISVEETGLDWISPDAGVVNTFSATGLTMTSVNGTGDNTIQQVGVTADDQAYKVDYTIEGSSLTAGNYLQFYNGATYVNMKTSVGNHILHFTRSGADDSVYLRLASNDGSTTDTVDIGSITIVEVQGWTLEDGKLVGDLPDLAKSATQDIGAIAGNSYKATMDVALAEEELITNGSFRQVGADLVLDGDFPLPNDNWLIAASTTINGGSATFGGLGAVTEAEMLLASFVVRVEADGGVVEAQTCLASDLTFLTENP